MRTQAERSLRKAYGAEAEFRAGQWEAIEALVVRRRRVLVVQRTGWGKSLVYFIATKLLRDAGSGLTLIISPLLSLMRNQLDAAERLGLSSATINSSNTDQWESIVTDLMADKIDLLLVSPEQLGSDQLAQEVLPTIQRGIGLLVVDEAHCISDWGHDFRPDYRRIVRIIRQLPRTVPLLGTTATANQRVVEDVATQLGPGLVVQRGPLARDSLVLQTIPLADQAERLAWLAKHLPNLPGTGIIYCLTVADCERVSAWLRSQGIDAPAYHAKILPEQRVVLEARLQANQCKALVATVALGMGYDKPDLGFVIHYQRPGSVVAYYQQVGRAGREVNRALAILLNGREDDEIQEYFINTAFPTAEDTKAVVTVLERTGGLTLAQILQRVNLSKGRVERVLKLLQTDEMVGKDGNQYFRTTHAFRQDRPGQAQITRLRRQELARMQAFVTHQGCLMEFIESELDDPDAKPCGRCANCNEDAVPRTVSEALTRAAVTYLKRDARVIEPRKQWPSLEDAARRGRIPTDLQVSEGRALCVLDDAGWGRLVHAGKYEAGRFADDLVVAVADMITNTWDPQPQPTWVTAVPSRKRPNLVPDFARRLAARLNLPYHVAIEKVKATPPQKTMQNSAQQALNAFDAFRVLDGLPDGPVLLVDDIVDSRWTVTICGALLREAGTGSVHPVALATAAGGGDVE